MQLEDWLDDLCVRFIVNLPPEELTSVERICFQVEEAQWFYEDFIRPLDPSLPSLSLKAFSLRIFQHCPLFSTWSMHHYTSAFAEFLAYKQRVPVRGAIMLNDEMDEVVLVKGWKKGANWSFPRGKINKDENDLSCAIREVYEETGYDIQAAGLVKPEKDMKYIEVTMREQHMRLYVFRGVPKNTHFEPKTRKEISKIEWYKLTDLPTLKKKHIHNDTQEENALNANKFYMVAPFLHPLKKWIAQQRKKENRYSSSHLAAPPMMLDESATDGEPGPMIPANYQPQVISPQVPSSLPEVATMQAPQIPQDPSIHLKELLNIGVATSQAPLAVQTKPAPSADLDKSNALLALLRNGSTAEMKAGPRSGPPALGSQAVLANQRDNVVSPPTMSSGNYPSLLLQQPQLPTQQRSLLDLFTKASISNQTVPDKKPPVAETFNETQQRPEQQTIAPYQRTGDPQFARDSPEDSRSQIIPPANALPKLTHHTRALLDAFKTAPPPPAQAQQPVSNSTQAPRESDRQTLLSLFKQPTQVLQTEPQPTNKTAPLSHPLAIPPPIPARQPQSSHASSLLGLFKSQASSASADIPVLEEPSRAPVELAAGPITSPQPQQVKPQPELLTALFRKDAPKRNPQATKAGETAATVEGPLNQPHFESIAKSPSQMSADSMRRSPVPAHRTLFDPKQSTPTKILQRSEESKKTQTKSPRQPKANLAAPSPKQKARTKPEKPFQPQILKRPQTADGQENIVKTLKQPAAQEATPSQQQHSPPQPPSQIIPIKTQPSRQSTISAPISATTSRRASQQNESQKQSLLSLLTNQSNTLNVGTTIDTNIDATKSQPPRQTLTPVAVSPLTQSQIVSPLTEEPPVPISTRSRMSSLASITGAGIGIAPDLAMNVNMTNRPKPEKRQTTAGDKAFLLGYLGRIASQEGDS